MTLRMAEPSALVGGLAVAVSLLATSVAAWVLVVLIDRYVGRCPVPSLGRGVVMGTGVQLALVAMRPDIPVLIGLVAATGFLPGLETFWRASLADLLEFVRLWGAWVAAVTVVGATVLVPLWVAPTPLTATQFALLFVVFAGSHAVLWGPLSARVGCWHEATHLAVLRLLGLDYKLSVELTESWGSFEVLREARWEVRYQDILSLSRPAYYALHLAPLAVAVPAAVVTSLLTTPLGTGVALGSYYGVLVHLGPSVADLDRGLSPVMRGPSAESVAAAQRNHGLAEGVPA